MKSRLLQQEHLRLNLSGSCAGKLEQLKYIKYLKMTQLTNFQYGQLFQTLDLLRMI